MKYSNHNLKEVKKMFLRKKGQSTAEYAAVLGVVLAVIVGVVGVALKGGIRAKNEQAMKYLLDAGGSGLPQGETAPLYTQEYRQTTMLGGENYRDISTMQKGGGETREQLQTTETTSYTVETLDRTQ
jgi:hypothetical protein